MLVFEDLQRADGQRLDLLALLVARSNASASRTLRPRLRRSWPIHLPPDRAKLGLATRLEAATVAHRLGLTPALGAPEVPGRDI
jgi:predicted ATPase